MSYKIAVASGKGGTGKTTVSINLYSFIWHNLSKNIQLIDCDVEEPNDVIFFPDAKIINEQEVYQHIPQIDNNKCNFCRKCVEYCEFNAIVVIPPVQFTEINSNLCHSCGACKYACYRDAITENPILIGNITHFKLPFGNGLLEGKLRIGSTMQTLMIKKLKKAVSEKNEIVIYDAPPGTSCPVVETITDADYVILVTEPTPFGLYDMKLMVELLRDLKKPFGVIINKAGLGNSDVFKYIHSEGIQLLGELPFNKKYAALYATGELLKNNINTYNKNYLEILKKLERRFIVYERNNYFKW